MARAFNGDPAHAEDFQYDVISGISVGSINAAGLAISKKGDELNGTEYLKSLWMNLHSEDIYKWWDGFEPYEAIVEKTGIFDTSPLKSLLDGILADHDHTI